MTLKSTTKQDDLLTNAKFWHLLSILCGNHDDTCHLAGRPAYSDHGLIVSWHEPDPAVDLVSQFYPVDGMKLQSKFSSFHTKIFICPSLITRDEGLFDHSAWANNKPSRIKFGRGIKWNYTFFARALVLVTIPGNKLVEHFYLAGIFLFLFFHAVRHELKERNDYFL